MNQQLKKGNHFSEPQEKQAYKKEGLGFQRAAGLRVLLH